MLTSKQPQTALQITLLCSSLALMFTRASEGRHILLDITCQILLILSCPIATLAYVSYCLPQLIQRPNCSNVYCIFVIDGRCISMTLFMSGLCLVGLAICSKTVQRGWKSMSHIFKQHTPIQEWFGCQQLD